ncbi:MAG: hypothetical protein BGN88_06825 [Clostridiales bacterium 43-6]|nr:MAG: hypothetical protein BGN88_06825 [Clostridiales bacterium 43-6]
MKYKTLLKLLDNICYEAPSNYKTYKPKIDNQDAVNSARSKCFIHLYLKVKMGLLDFKERQTYITEGPYDGGLDAYYINNEKRLIYLIQSKFRTNQNNFEEKELSLDDLIKMETESIIQGEEVDSNGNRYNSKIINMQTKINQIPDIARYKYKIIILGNLKRYNSTQISRIIGGLEYEIFDFERTYSELVLPMCKSNYYDTKEIEWIINISDNDFKILNQQFDTSIGKCNIHIAFIPLKSVAEFMLKFKNSVLQFNPRNYLDLARNSVNISIEKSISSNKTNDFSLLNNGITIVCSKFSHQSSTGSSNNTQVIVENTQIINGGQTACTISKIKDKAFLTNKKVMIKFISAPTDDYENYLRFIDTISNATNLQTKVTEPDRKSNTLVQRQLQIDIFMRYGYLYEIKKGEFGEVKDLLGKDNQIINRIILTKCITAFQGFCARARSESDSLFGEKFDDLFAKFNTSEIMLSYLCYSYLLSLKATKRNGYLQTQYGNALRYGKYAVIQAISVYIKNNIIKYDENGITKIANDLTQNILNQWNQFEIFIQTKITNSTYFNKNSDFGNYFKSKNAENDIDDYNWMS